MSVDSRRLDVEARRTRHEWSSTCATKCAQPQPCSSNGATANAVVHRQPPCTPRPRRPGCYMSEHQLPQRRLMPGTIPPAVGVYHIYRGERPRILCTCVMDVSRSGPRDSGVGRRLGDRSGPSIIATPHGKCGFIFFQDRHPRGGRLTDPSSTRAVLSSNTPPHAIWNSG